jgi:membrane protein
MPRSAFALFHDTLNQISSGASNVKLSFGLLVSLWSSSSGVAALIEGLNIAFAVPDPRSLWRPRLLAVALTLAIGVLIAAALVFLFISHAAGAFVAASIPVLSTLSTLSNALHRAVGLLLLVASLMLLYRFGPNLKQKPWEGLLPGCCMALLGWTLASLGFRLYLLYFSSFNRTYGSLAGVIVLLFWLYLSAAAILLGGELNSIIWQAVANKKDVRFVETPEQN